MFDACWCLWSSAMAGRTEGQVQHKGEGRHWPGCRVHKRVTCQSQAPALLSWMNLNKMSRPCLLNCKTASVVNSKKARFTLPQLLSSYSGPPIFRLLFLNSSKQQKWHPPGAWWRHRAALSNPLRRRRGWGWHQMDSGAWDLVLAD